MIQVLAEVYDGQEVFFRNENGQPEVRINEVAKFCGWTEIGKSGNESIKWRRVNKYLVDLGASTQVATGDYIPEYIMYPLIGKAQNEKATKFMLWVGQIMTQLRNTGVVILDHAKEDAIEFEKKFGKYRIRKTFTNSKNVLEDYKQFLDLSKVEWKSKRLNNVDRVKLSNIIAGAIQDRINNNVLGMKPSEILQLQELISDIKTDIIKLSNKKNGGDKTARTKKINKLQKQIDSLNSAPGENDFITLDTHGFSNNYQYRYCEGGTYKTEAYKKWIKYFPRHQVPSIDHWELDLDKPVEVFINYIAKADLDIRNLDKALLDQLFTRIYKVDDNIVHSVHSQRVGVVDSFEDGQVSIHIRNIETNPIGVESVS